MCSILFEEVSRAMLSLSKPFQAEACDVSITSHTQDRSCITSRAELDITTQDMTLVYPIYTCTLNTEPFLGGHDQLWVQVEVPKPLGASSKPRCQLRGAHRNSDKA
ncbi:hypothetical protein CHARACLAT_025029 [Characodon lateralis]|uniref:Uncharacterized protein n=1 Tax=Characodon lateralis TaxID=208331 RepID=A0ABU7EWT6_9TELE|nr:hypothetical protein [Characodon lateralis]